MRIPEDEEKGNMIQNVFIAIIAKISLTLGKTWTSRSRTPKHPKKFV
jgi:hypothetical protein